MLPSPQQEIHHDRAAEFAGPGEAGSHLLRGGGRDQDQLFLRVEPPEDEEE